MEKYFFLTNKLNLCIFDSGGASPLWRSAAIRAVRGYATRLRSVLRKWGSWGRPEASGSLRRRGSESHLNVLRLHFGKSEGWKIIYRIHI